MRSYRLDCRCDLQLGRLARRRYGAIDFTDHPVRIGGGTRLTIQSSLAVAVTSEFLAVDARARAWLARLLCRTLVRAPAFHSKSGNSKKEE
jgi:hypothetical protein